MKSIQLGGVLVKGKKELPPKFTGPARYRGAKRIKQLWLFGQFGWHRE